MDTSTQILVIGGGPAGSTAAALLAKEGFTVTLVDRAIFPRYHIGESLLPICQDVFELLGVKEEVAACGFPKKYGSYFEWGKEQWEINFADAQGRPVHGYQVEREAFDHLLLENAKRHGVRVFEGVEIRDLTFDGDRPRQATWVEAGNSSQKGEIVFDYLVDASGRTGIMSTRYLKNRHYNESFQNVAVWGYWKGTKPIPRGPQGGIAIVSVPQGWFWAIPQRDNIMSIGLVIHKSVFQEKRKQAGSLEQLYADAVRECEMIAGLVEPATFISEIMVEQDYSYSAEKVAGPGYFITGDAACFLDPLLSTGVHLAMFSAMLVAASLSSILHEEVEEAEAQNFYAHSYQMTYLRFLILVAGLYQQYRGNSSYFWDAQQLSRNDYSEADLNYAFMNIIGGLEDLKDAERGSGQHILHQTTSLYQDCIALMQKRQEWAKLTAKEREEALRKVRQFNAMQERPSLTPETAVEGLYVERYPRLRLAKAHIQV